MKKLKISITPSIWDTISSEVEVPWLPEGLKLSELSPIEMLALIASFPEGQALIAEAMEFSVREV